MKNTLIISVALMAIGSFINIAEASTQLLIKLKPSQEMLSANLTEQQIRNQLMEPFSSATLNHLSLISGIKLYDIKPLAIGGRVVRSNSSLTTEQLKVVIARLQQAPNIEYVEPDIKGEFASDIGPSDIGLLNPVQWNMTSTSYFALLGTYYHGSYFTGSSSGTIGVHVPENYGNNVVVADIDSGYTPHPNFVNNLVPLSPGSNQYGYQFITTCAEACTCTSGESADTPIPYEADALDHCGIQSWHGTMVLGIIAANGYNTLQSQGVTGGAPAATLLPIRVAGGTMPNIDVFISDIINSMMWAGGHHVDGTLDNAHPAQVINMPVSFPESCSTLPNLQETIKTLHEDNINIVVSAMNSESNIANWSPAGCPNIISVAAVGPTQVLASYSNYGDVTISAPGGSTDYINGMIYSTTCNNSASKNNQNANIGCNFQNSNNFGWTFGAGTSYAAPTVSAAIAALLSKFPTLHLNPDQIIEILQNSATPYLSGNNCSTSGCVANGILNTEAAISFAGAKYSGSKR